MIIDLEQFIQTERPYWDELESILDRLEQRAAQRLSLPEITRFHYLYERVSSSLAKLSTFSTERETQRYLESLVARAYGEIHESREKPHRFRPLHWFFVTFPQAFRRHIRAFKLASAILIIGSVFGGAMIGLDPSSKEVLMPFRHLMGDPTERVEQEETANSDQLAGRKAQGAAWYMKHNTSVAIYTMAMGATWGIGTILLLFSNGIMLGAVMVDYILAGETVFLIGWLLPHGSVEIPAILVAGQAGLVFGGALIGWGTTLSLRMRLRRISADLVTLIAGVAVLLTWAGIIESFLSQYHEPALPYAVKIAFGAAEVVLLTAFLGWSGEEEVNVSRERTLLIRTPEGIVFPLVTASPIARFLALAIDLACIWTLTAIVTFIGSMTQFISTDLAGAVWMLSSFACSLGYPIVLEWFMRGQTFGKKILRLRVMDVQALRLTFSQVVVRNLLRFVDAFPYFYLVGGAASLISARGQRLGDLAANTIVVYQPKIAEPDLEQALPGKFNSFREYPHLAARLRQAIQPREAGLLLQALLRRDLLDDEHRLTLFRELREYIEAVETFPAEATEGISDEQYVRNVVDILFR